MTCYVRENVAIHEPTPPGSVAKFLMNLWLSYLPYGSGEIVDLKIWLQ